MPTRPAPPLAAVPNLRDAGGLETVDGGRVRTGLLYRSGQLDRLDDGALERFAALGVATVVDLRTTAERTAGPDRLPDGVGLLVANVLGDHDHAVPAQLPRLIRSPADVERAVRDGVVQRLFEQTYREFVTLPSAREAYALLFRSIADAGDDAGPLLYHCTAGKDRTGWASASLLMLLGVPDEAILDDFMLSDELALRAFRPLIDAFAAGGGDPDALRPILGVQPGYLRAGVDHLRAVHGTIEGWFADGLGLGADVQARLRERLLER
ncbi:tyrosine-protein phosphatase [Conexibacter arvalis]|uniref:Protein-tyrosine phosphatase n=1 Tax=Conexibacter arvalis TaxID=912552 RepID=A0A840IFN8_9ACTN|nr:protein-tyrosine phosphatase [Conexibacter arvalis]